MGAGAHRDLRRFIDSTMDRNVPKAHLIAIPKGGVSHQREQLALISHGAIKLVFP